YGAPLERIDEILKMMDMLEAKKTIVKKLSKGMMQRILLAKALMHRPKLLFLDEPTSALDPANMMQIHRVLKELNEQGSTIVSYNHNMEAARVLCDRIAPRQEGEIKQLPTPAKIRYQYSSPKFHVTTKHEEVLDLPTDATSADDIATLIKTNNVTFIQTDHPTLGEIFIKVTGKELV